MIKKVAIFVDWENLRQDISSIQKNNRDFREFNYNNVKHLSSLFQAFIDEDEEIYRIFFYTAPPKTSQDILNSFRNDNDKQNYQEYLDRDNNNQNFQNIYSTSKKLINDISKEPYVATRLGELKISGILTNGKPIISQKQVDMLLGLDIAHVSYNKLVDRILIFCKDSDMTPALKVARTTGLITIVAHIKGGFTITNSLIKHSDIIREKTVNTILNRL